MNFRTLLCAFVLLAFAACNDENTAPAEPQIPYATENKALIDGAIVAPMPFYGESVVTTLATGDTFSDPAARFEMVADGEGMARLLMHESHFAETMPALEMEVPAIPCTVEGVHCTLTAPAIIPEIAGVPYERYTLTEIDGRIDGVQLEIAFVCAGTFRVEYRGRLLAE